MTDISDVTIISDVSNLKMLDEPTKHPAKCIFCAIKLSGLIPRLYILRHTYRFGLTNGYICIQCARRNYDSKQDRIMIGKYKDLLLKKYREVLTVEEL